MNYKKLRSSLRKGFAKEIRRNQVIENKIQKLLIKHLDDPQRRSLLALTIALKDFATNIQASVSASIERTVLIEKQIDQKCFDGKLHNDYHLKSQQLQTSYHNSIQNAKRLANSLARVIGTFYAHSERRGLRFGSFGKLYASVKDNWVILKTTPEGIFLSKVVLFGDNTENTIHKYRDIVLEHTDPSRPHDSTNLTIYDSKVQIANYHPMQTDNPLPEIEFDQSMTNWVYHDIRNKKGQFIGEEYIVHAYLRTDLKPGNAISKGDPLLYITDMSSGHFDKHDSHIHTFRTSSVSDEMIGASTPFEMPEINELVKLYFDFIETTLGEIEQSRP